MFILYIIVLYYACLGLEIINPSHSPVKTFNQNLNSGSCVHLCHLKSGQGPQISVHHPGEPSNLHHWAGGLFFFPGGGKTNSEPWVAQLAMRLSSDSGNWYFLQCHRPKIDWPMPCFGRSKVITILTLWLHILPPSPTTCHAARSWRWGRCMWLYYIHDMQCDMVQFCFHNLLNLLRSSCRKSRCHWDMKHTIGNRIQVRALLR